jgi:hypothetical protein
MGWSQSQPPLLIVEVKAELPIPGEARRNHKMQAVAVMIPAWLPQPFYSLSRKTIRRFRHHPPTPGPTPGLALSGLAQANIG